jgi:hypothetical protein
MAYRYPLWKEQLVQAREKYMLANYAAARDHGVPAKQYSDKTANGLTACIIDFLKYNGHYANRINTTGMMRKINGQMKWTKSSTRIGTSDIDAILAGKPVKIEIKVGKDRMSDAQLKEQARVTAAGGTYITVTNMTHFIEWYHQFVKNKRG